MGPLMGPRAWRCHRAHGDVRDAGQDCDWHVVDSVCGGCGVAIHCPRGTAMTLSDAVQVWIYRRVDTRYLRPVLAVRAVVPNRLRPGGRAWLIGPAFVYEIVADEVLR